MPFSILLWVLGAALLHAAWNIIVKGGTNKVYETSLNCLGGGLGAMFILPFVPLPATESLTCLALSCLFHFLGYFCVAATYRVTDLTFGYPIMRGAAPAFTAIILMIYGIPLPMAGWLGILLLCSGILSLALEQKLHQQSSFRGILYCLRAAVMVTCYTLADGFGARLSGSSLAYTCWLFFLDIFPMQIYVLWHYGADYINYLKKRGAIGICGGLCSLGSYGIAIWAMTLAPIALVAALRETSVIFGMIMAVIFLHEKLTPGRLFAIVLVMAGAMLTRLG